MEKNETPVLALNNLSKRYGTKEAVSNLNFSLSRGELVGLLGPNGAGKSTTLRMIAGSMAPSSGTVRIAGYDITEQSRQAKSVVGYLPETPPLYPEMTVAEYLRFSGDLKNYSGGGNNSGWAEDLARRLAIENVMPVLIRNLSKGYKQRVGIAAAAMGRPSLLLLDEPVSGLDPRQAAELRSLLKYLAAYMAIIVSSHGLYEVASLCTRIIIMNKGRVVADGAPACLARIKSGAQTEDSETGSMRLARDLEDVFINLTNPEAG